MDKKSISVIVPNYNGRQLLEAYLPCTIAALEQSGAAYELIVVDDCSTDDSVAFVSRHYPRIVLIRSPENRGFSHACNRGIGLARHELIFLLNSDVKLMPDYFAPLWRYFRQGDTFGVMGRIIDMEGDGIQDAARVPGFRGLKLKTEWFCYSAEPSATLFTMYLSGANALIDARKLKELGGFDELFSPFYSEDMELSIRAWRLGWKCYYEHAAVCRHRLSATTSQYRTPKWVKTVYFRNRFYFHLLHFEGLAAYFYGCQIVLLDLPARLLAGQWWILDSYRQLFQNRQLIRRRKRAFREKMAACGSTASLFTIVSKIRQAARMQPVVRFKP